MNEPVSGGPFRRFGIDYAGPMLDDDLAEALIDMVNASGRHVDGADDGPLEHDAADEIERLRAAMCPVCAHRRGQCPPGRCDRCDDLRDAADEIERLRAVVRTAQESLHQAMERIRFMEATKRSINPVAKSYLEQAERVLAEVLGDE